MLKNVVNQYFCATVGANHAQMERLRESLTAMVTGWSIDQVKEIINESIHSAIGPMIYDEAATLIEKHISDGRDIIIVSTSGKEIVEPIGKLLGATTVIATEMIIEDGKYTGAVAFYAYGEKKAEAIKKLAKKAGKPKWEVEEVDHSDIKNKIASAVEVDLRKVPIGVLLVSFSTHQTAPV